MDSDREIEFIVYTVKKYVGFATEIYSVYFAQLFWRSEVTGTLKGQFTELVDLFDKE